MSKTLKIFVTYAHKDEEAKDELIKRLAVLKQDGLISIWHDNEILAGDRWRDAVFNTLAVSDLLFYLTSASSLASENCNKELAAALKGRKMQVIPIILESCDWQNHPLSDFEVLPHKGKPLNKWEPESDGWQNVVEGIRRTITTRHCQVSEGAQNGGLTDWVFQQGNFWMMIEQTDTAIEAYSHAINLAPHHAEAYYNRGLAERRRGRHEEAIADYSKALRLKPDFAEAYVNRGNAKLLLGHHEAAIADFDQAICLKPDEARAYYNRGNARAALGQLEAAIADFEESVRLKPDDARPYLGRGMAKNLLGQPEAAIADFDTAIRLQMESTDAYINRGYAKVLLEHPEAAIEDFDAAIRINPRSAGAYYNRGYAKAALGRLEAAIEDFDAAIRLKADFANAYYNRGVAKIRLGQDSEAEPDFQMAAILAEQVGDQRLLTEMNQNLHIHG